MSILSPSFGISIGEDRSTYTCTPDEFKGHRKKRVSLPTVQTKLKIKLTMSYDAKPFVPPFRVTIDDNGGQAHTHTVIKQKSNFVYKLLNSEILSIPPEVETGNLIKENRPFESDMAGESLNSFEALKQIEIIDYFIQQPRNDLFLHGINLWRIFANDFLILKQEFLIEKAQDFLAYLVSDLGRVNTFLNLLNETTGVNDDNFLGEVVLGYLSKVKSHANSHFISSAPFFIEFLELNEQLIELTPKFIKLTVLSLLIMISELSKIEDNNQSSSNEKWNRDLIRYQKIRGIHLLLRFISKDDTLIQLYVVEINQYLTEIEKCQETDVNLWTRLIHVAARSQHFKLIERTLLSFIRSILTNPSVKLNDTEISHYSSHIRQMLLNLSAKKLVLLLNLNSDFMKSFKNFYKPVNSIFSKDLIYLYRKILASDLTYIPTSLLDYILTQRRRHHLSFDLQKEINFLTEIDLPLFKLLSVRSDTSQFDLFFSLLNRYLKEVKDSNIQDELNSIFSKIAHNHSKHPSSKRVRGRRVSKIKIL